jgi:hypothetical protein
VILRVFHKPHNGIDFSYTVPLGAIAYVQYASGEIFEGIDSEEDHSMLREEIFYFKEMRLVLESLDN